MPRCQRRQRSEYTEHHGKRWQRLSREWKEKWGNRSCMFNERAGRGAERETWHLCVHVYMRTYVRCVCAWETNKGWNIIPLQHELIQHKRNTLMWRKELTASQACQCGCVQCTWSHYRRDLRLKLQVWEEPQNRIKRKRTRFMVYTSLFG